MKNYYAHSIEGAAQEEWQTLADHLNSVAGLSASFAGQFGCETWGRTLGLLHDAGKGSEAFQKRLCGGPSVDHATYGARRALELYGETPTFGEMIGALLAYPIAGHHSGMPNGYLVDGESSTNLKDRLKRDVDPAPGFEKLIEGAEVIPPDVTELEELPWQRSTRCLPACQSETQHHKSMIYSCSLVDRMLYSSLVDADWLDTERVMDPDKAAKRKHDYPSIDQLLGRFDAYMDNVVAGAVATPVNEVRADIRKDCIRAAELPPGLFTLTVPTGGGKTNASMELALRHAVLHGMSRVIYAIPFMSIVEQTADTFKEIFSREVVLEHHSNYDFDREGDGDASDAQRLAVQNWDAPIIVTTNVQLLESLHSNKPSKCRKLHNIANSVIVLDEAQTIPDGLLRATLAMLEGLVIDFHCSIVLCTATQPAIDGLWPFGSKPREIAVHNERFDEVFGRRIRFELERDVESSDIAEQMSEHNQALCIVGTKRKSVNLYHQLIELVLGPQKLGEKRNPWEAGIFHLSANMTPWHRSEVLREVKRRLAAGEDCRVVSTQVIEAGVDVDFPVVFREMAGVDSLFQAAGRCNREGLRPEGIVHVFQLADDRNVSKQNWLENMKAIALGVIEDNGGRIDDSLVRSFFEERYFHSELDAKRVFASLTADELARQSMKNIPFEKCARDYRIIEDETTPIFVPWGERGIKLLAELQNRRDLGLEVTPLASKLQQYSVSVWDYLFKRLQDEGVIEPIGPFFILKLEQDCRSFYDDEVGLLEPGEEEAKTLVF